MNSGFSTIRPSQHLTEANPLGWKRRIAAESVRSARQGMRSSPPHDANQGARDDAVNLVTLLFKNILQDDRISPQMRLLFARLHVVIMRAALAEPRAFATDVHPARALVALMVSSVMGLEGDQVAKLDLEAAITQVVLFIEQASPAGQAVFEQMHRDFQKFLASVPTSEYTRPQAMTSDMDTLPMPLREDRAAFATEYASWIKDTLKGLSVRPEVLSFLGTVWVDVLAMTAFYRGRHHAETIAFKKAVIDLIWLSGAKTTRRSRSRVIGEVQTLLQQLRTGMTLIGLSFDEQKVHLDAISSSMVDAFLAVGKHSGTPPPPQTTPTARMCSVHEYDLRGLDVSEHQSESVWSLFEDVEDKALGGAASTPVPSRLGPPSALMPDISFVWSHK